MIKACAITDKGLEKIALMELDEIIKVKGKVEDNVVIFNCKSFQDLFKFCYLSQSVERVILLPQRLHKHSHIMCLCLFLPFLLMTFRCSNT